MQISIYRHGKISSIYEVKSKAQKQSSGKILSLLSKYLKLYWNTEKEEKNKKPRRMNTKMDTVSVEVRRGGGWHFFKSVFSKIKNE